MNDILYPPERIKNTIQLGESHYREFKTAFEGKPGKKRPRLTKHICQNIGEALVAFANADGGQLLIGIEDDGRITGVPHTEEQIQEMLQAVKTHVFPGTILPITSSGKVELDGYLVLFFAVDAGTTKVYHLPDGRCVRRKGSSTLPAESNHIEFSRQEARSREYDGRFVDGASVTDLDTQLIQVLANEYIRGLSIERYLQQIGLAEYDGIGLRLKRSALLLFAKDILKWHSRCQVRILKVAGTELKSGAEYNATYDEIVRGNIFELITESWNALRPYLAHKTVFGKNAQFVQQYIYPEQACREALTNAIAHRDYSAKGTGIEVFVFDDRIEIRSPGALLSTLTVADLEALQGAHESRNVNIVRVLSENQYMRDLGEGIPRMFTLMQDREMIAPAFYSNTTSFSVTLSNDSIYSPRQTTWLAQLEGFELTPAQKRIMLLGIDGAKITLSDIYKAINSENKDVYDRTMTPLLEQNLLRESPRQHRATFKDDLEETLGDRHIPRFELTRIWEWHIGTIDPHTIE